MKLLKKAPRLREVSLQMTSMIDVVLLLVVFFMCTAQLSKLEVDPGVVLPVTQSGTDSPDEGRMIVNVSRGGELRVLNAGYSPEALAELIAKEAARRPDPEGGSALAVKIRADADVPFARVGDVMTACRRAGVWRLSFGTQRPEVGPKM